MPDEFREYLLNEIPILVIIYETGDLKELVNILRARSFGNKGFAYVTVNNENIYLNLRLSISSNFT